MTFAPEFQSFLTTVLLMGLAAGAPALAAFIVAKVVSTIRLAKTEVSETNFDMFMIVVRKVVAAAHQAGLAGLVKNEGTLKKEWAINAAKALFKQVGLGNIDVDALSAAIEAEVFAFYKKLEAETAVELPGLLEVGTVKGG